MGYFESKGGGEERPSGMMQQHLRATNSQEPVHPSASRSHRMVLAPGESCGCPRGRQPPRRKGGSKGEEYLSVTFLPPPSFLISPPTGQTL